MLNGQRLDVTAQQIVKEHFEISPKPSIQFADIKIKAHGDGVPWFFVTIRAVPCE